MNDLNTKRIFALAKLKEQEVRTYLDYYRKKMGDDNIRLVQEMTSSYAALLAESFIGKHEKFFAQEENRRKIRHEISVLGADKPHSGYRFWEALSKTMNNQAWEKQDQTEEIENN